MTHVLNLNINEVYHISILVTFFFFFHAKNRDKVSLDEVLECSFEQENVGVPCLGMRYIRKMGDNDEWMLIRGSLVTFRDLSEH